MTADTTAPYEWVMLGGDISYAEGDDPVWQTYLRMIEPLAARTPFVMGYGNHELVPRDSGGENGTATNVRFGSPNTTNSGSPYWFSWVYKTARFIMLSTFQWGGLCRHRRSPLRTTNAHPPALMHPYAHPTRHRSPHRPAPPATGHITATQTPTSHFSAWGS